MRTLWISINCDIFELNLSQAIHHFLLLFRKLKREQINLYIIYKIFVVIKYKVIVISIHKYIEIYDLFIGNSIKYYIY